MAKNGSSGWLSGYSLNDGQTRGQRAAEASRIASLLAGMELTASIHANQAAAPINNDRSIPVNQAVPPRRYVYGNTRVGGAIFLYDNNNPWLYVGLALSDGVIEQVQSLYFGDTLVPLTSGIADNTTRFFDKLRMESTTGLSTETASATLLAAFTSLTSDFRQRGVARAIVSMHWGDSSDNHNILWGDTITPAILIKGVKVYDPRDGTQTLGTESTYKYSANPVLHIAHAITHVWGSPIAESFIDWSAVSAAATIADTASTTTTATAFTLFTGAGVFSSGSDYGQQIQQMLSAIGGSLYMANGLYKIKADQPETSAFTITDADIIAVQSYQHEGRRRDTPNAVKAKYYNTTNASEDISITVENSAAVTAEGLREKAIELPYTDNEKSAQVLAYRALVNSRAGRALSLVVSDAACFLEPTERVTISSASFPVANGDYRIDQIEPLEFGVSLQLSQYDSAAYDNPNTYVIG